MEKYQNQLEDLVEERTAELRDEKRRTDLLLQRMLPASVAQQAKKNIAYTMDLIYRINLENYLVDTRS